MKSALTAQPTAETVNSTADSNIVSLAPETVAQHSGHGHAADRTDERTPNEPSLLHGVQRELRGHTGYRTRNDRRVVPEQNPAYGGYQ